MSASPLKGSAWSAPRGCAPDVQDRPPDPGPAVRLSQAGHCARQIAYSAAGFEKVNPPTPRMRRVLAQGTAIHEFLREEIAAGLWQGVEPTEVPTRDEDEQEVRCEIAGVEVTGHPDGIVTVDGHEAVLEVKSTNAYGFRRRKADGPDPYHLAQGSMYATCLGLFWVFVVYFCKDTADVWAFLRKANPELVSDATKKWEQAIAAGQELATDEWAQWDDPRLPDQGHHPNGDGVLPWQCNYCRYVSGCYEDAEQVGTTEKPKYRTQT